MPILDTKEDRRLRHLRDEHGTYSAAVIYFLETQLAESKADEWNAFIKRKQAEVVEECSEDLYDLQNHFDLNEDELTGLKMAIQYCTGEAQRLRAEANAEGDTNED